MTCGRTAITSAIGDFRRGRTMVASTIDDFSHGRTVAPSPLGAGRPLGQEMMVATLQLVLGSLQLHDPMAN
ncbi:hypothetical protein B296_00017220 [Ensete ventricosum]|uniref:Uncharacterized protein n=1 Tax=Ensete ventricosum TaxID=4639 RepID=A0A426ZQ10_ENSVE|nr:hypothetical protein B296_00017220 [Ensete ventricosum]